MAGTILSLLMLAGVALTAGGLYLVVRLRDRKRGALMLLAAAVMFTNVAIWIMPTGTGETLSTANERPH